MEEYKTEIAYWAGRLIGYDQAWKVAEEIVDTIKKAQAQALHIRGVVEQSEQLKCDCCNGTGMVEGDYRDEVESCLTCNGRGTF
jgi:hypothetical protein